MCRDDNFVVSFTEIICHIPFLIFFNHADITTPELICLVNLKLVPFDQSLLCFCEFGGCSGFFCFLDCLGDTYSTCVFLSGT